jgi:hypothetical protein
MAAGFVKTPITTTDPFDGSTVTILQVTPTINGVEIPSECLTFPDGTPDPTIQSEVEIYLTNKGYQI